MNADAPHASRMNELINSKKVPEQTASGPRLRLPFGSESAFIVAGMADMGQSSVTQTQMEIAYGHHLGALTRNIEEAVAIGLIHKNGKTYKVPWVI